LALDDYHLIENQAVHEALTFLLEHLPPNLHLFIATRSDPPLHLARLRGRGQLNELRPTDLRLRPDEAAKFLNQVMKLDLAADDVAALASRTEGWIAGLQMATLAIQAAARDPGAQRASDFIRAFTSSNRFIMDYLVEEVLQQQPAPIQTFLLHTSILNRLTAPLCAAVVKDIGDYRPQSEAERGWRPPLPTPQFPNSLLQHLESSNLFIIPLDEQQRWYRYHHLFADLLRQRLQRIQPGVVPELHRRASAWYEQEELLEPAIEHALSAGDFERAAGLVEQNTEATGMRGEFSTFLSWLEDLPDETLRAQPRLRAYQAVLLMLTGRPLDEFKSLVQEVAQGDVGDRAAGEVAVFRSILAVLRGDVRDGAQQAQRALEYLPDESWFMRGLAIRGLSAAYKMTGDVAAAARALEDGARIARKAGDLLGVVVTGYQLAELRFIQGRLDEAQALFKKALELAVDGQGRPLPIVAKASVGLGELLRERNELDAAENYILQSVELAEKWVKTWGIGSYLILALVRQSQGD
ncbi:MAG: tetratricopeptide repeat protein, partial [Delftia sp.]|nr:tetratricopeptide repeat protein [Delftia sp.]